jgi:predicted CopG family antitoxin
LTITVSDDVYKELRNRVGSRNISKFMNELARDHLQSRSLAIEYADAARDEQAEQEALAWIEAGVGECLPDEDFSGCLQLGSRCTRTYQNQR